MRDGIGGAGEAGIGRGCGSDCFALFALKRVLDFG